jgi:hypothetical protein
MLMRTEAMNKADENMALRMKLDQARLVIARLIGDGAANGAEDQRALDYFAGDRYDPDFLPWPRQDDEGMRPEDLNAANDG